MIMIINYWDIQVSNREIQLGDLQIEICHLNGQAIYLYLEIDDLSGLCIHLAY
jgi:hypothetical protein